jgi:uroporphyrinogen-III decarboxylase
MARHAWGNDMTTALTHRERVLLALDHQPTDRVPISMVGAYTNPPAQEQLEIYLRRERGKGSAEYLAAVVDLQAVGPRYVGPPPPAGTDYWGVHRTAVSFGSVADVRREARMLIDTLGDGGGYLCGPSHAIQAGTPPENIVAMFDEAATPSGM